MKKNISLFSSCPIWEFQRRYFMEAGIDAWKEGEVPHYVTSNPRMARTYAEIILSFLKDNELQTKEPLYIIELGAGSGRFTYHLLKALSERTEHLPEQQRNFVYVATDYAEKNLWFWEQHPRLKPYIENRFLDTAYFDAEQDTTLYLRHRKKTIDPDTLYRPFIVVANYFFDSIRQELFYFHNGEVQDVLVEINNPRVKKGQQETGFSLNYTYRSLEKFPFSDPVQEEIAEMYRSDISESHVLFPHTGMSCINRLKQLSRKGLLLITADKGYHRLEELENRPVPQLIQHGSFSLTANYHALKLHCEKQGGKALFPKHPHAHINIGCLMYMKDHELYRETRAAYLHAVNNFGPDDYFSIKKHVEKQIPSLSVDQLFSYLRLSSYDSRLFSQFLPAFHSRVGEFTNNERFAFLQLTAKVWDGYYPLGEETDLAFSIGEILFGLQFFKEALSFFNISVQLYGTDDQKKFNIAICYQQLGHINTARTLLKEVSENFPGNEELERLMNSI